MQRSSCIFLRCTKNLIIESDNKNGALQMVGLCFRQVVFEPCGTVSLVQTGKLNLQSCYDCLLCQAILNKKFNKSHRFGQVWEASITHCENIIWGEGLTSVSAVFLSATVRITVVVVPTDSSVLNFAHLRTMAQHVWHITKQLVNTAVRIHHCLPRNCHFDPEVRCAMQRHFDS